MDRKEYKKQWYQKNKERISEEYKNMYKENSEKIKERVKNYRDNNKEKIKERDKKYYELNKEKIKETNKKWYENNKEKIKLYKKEWSLKNRESLRERRKIWYEKNKSILHEKIKLRQKNDSLFNLTCQLRKSILKSFRNRSFEKPNSTTDILGCSFEFFKTYLESQFEPWMNWDNRGLYNGQPNYGWDIDHNIPLDIAETKDELIKLNHYTNLKPLCSYVNRVTKRAKV